MPYTIRDIFEMNKHFADFVKTINKDKLLESAGFFYNNQNPYLFLEDGSIYNLFLKKWVFKGNSKTKVLKNGLFFNRKILNFKVLENDWDIIVLDLNGNVLRKIHLEFLFDLEKLTLLYENNKTLFFVIVNNIIFINNEKIMIPELEGMIENDPNLYYFIYNLNEKQFEKDIYLLHQIDLPFNEEFSINQKTIDSFLTKERFYN